MLYSARSFAHTPLRYRQTNKGKTFGSQMFAKNIKEKDGIIARLKKINAQDIKIEPLDQNPHGQKYKITYKIPSETNDKK